MSKIILIQLQKLLNMVIFIQCWSKVSHIEIGRYLVQVKSDSLIIALFIPPCSKLAPFPQGGHRKFITLMCETFNQDCIIDTIFWSM